LRSPIAVRSASPPRATEGGGITVAFATSAGTMPMRILRPGERIEVVP
jgi:hypothetical protein